MTCRMFNNREKKVHWQKPLVITSPVHVYNLKLEVRLGLRRQFDVARPTRTAYMFCSSVLYVCRMSAVGVFPFSPLRFFPRHIFGCYVWRISELYNTTRSPPLSMASTRILKLPTDCKFKFPLARETITAEDGRCSFNCHS